LRKSKKYNLDVWEAISEATIPIKVGQLAEFPTFRQQIRKGISDAGPGWEVVQVNTMQEEEEDRPRKSSAYTQCQLE
jgi:hypothetical protein